MANILEALGKFLGGATGSAVGGFRSAFTHASDAEVRKALSVDSVQQLAIQGGPLTGIRPKGVNEAKGILNDPLSYFDTTAGYHLRPSRLTYQVLEQMAHSATIVRIIHIVRLNQIALFTKRASSDFDIGFRIVPRDPNQNITPATRKKIQELEKWLECCGDPKRDGAKVVTDNFTTFTRKVMRDSLIYDQMNWQMVGRTNGKPYEMIAMPAQTMRVMRVNTEASETTVLNESSGEVTIKQAKPGDHRYVQVYQDVPIASFSPEELVWGVRNPSTNLTTHGYGWSELEDAVHLVSSWLYTMQYNSRFFSQGTTATGILTFKGLQTTRDQREMEQFRDQWHSLVTGVHNAFRTPIVDLSDKGEVNWIDLQKTNRDMQFSEWQIILVKLFCGLYAIDPMEAGFPLGDAGGSSTFNNRRENRIKASKDKGLRPPLALFQEKLNVHCIQRLDEDFMVEFIGLDSEDEKDRVDKAKEKASTFMMVDEVRREFNLDPMPDKKGEVILSQIWLQNAQTIDQGGEEGEGGEEGGEGDQGGYENEEGDYEVDDPVDAAAKSLRADLLGGIGKPSWTEGQEGEYQRLITKSLRDRPSPWDVSSGATRAGVDVRGGKDSDEALSYGLVTRQVGGTRIFGKSDADVERAASYLEKGGTTDDPEFQTALGAEPEVVAMHRRMRELGAKRARVTLTTGVKLIVKGKTS